MNQTPSEWVIPTEIAAEKAATCPDLALARVCAVHRGFFDLMGVPGVEQGVLQGGWVHDADPESLPTVGDWVGVSPGGGPIVPIQHVFDRRSLFLRRAAGRRSQAQPIAANVDTVFVVTDLRLDYNPRRIERYLIAIAHAGAQPVLVLNKADLAATLTTDTLAFDGPIVRLSALTGEGIAALDDYLGPDQTVALVGSSGVGKSTLTNRLLGQATQDTGGLRSGDEKGRHTTTARALFRLPGGGALIDTPGMRALALLVDEEALDDVFEEVTGLLGTCAFRNCNHGGEPGCAIAGAIDDGRLTMERWRSYLKLQREIAYEASRSDTASRRAQARARQKMIKTHVSAARARRERTGRD